MAYGKEHSMSDAVKAGIQPGSHPGIYLKQILADRGWTQIDLTFILGCQPKAVNQIINEKQGVSPAMSKALGQALNLPADYFAEIQKNHDIASASDPNPSVSIRAKMKSNYPIRDMIKRGWITDGDAEKLQKQLSAFFEVTDPTEIPYLAHAARKNSYEEREIPPSQLAWLFRVRQVAKSIPAPKYSEKALKGALGRLRELLVAPEESRHVPRILGDCGIRFVLVETLPSAKIDGVCFWLAHDSPVIGLSLRHDRIDNFWFVLRHEIEHVLRRHGMDGGVVDAELEGERAGTGSNIPVEEQVANAEAANFCVPNEKIDSFIKRKHPFYYEKDVLAFSKLHGIHPGIVVGQMQHRLKRYDYLRKYQVKIRHCVLPGAIADGWKQNSI